MDYTEDKNGQETQPLSVPNSQDSASEDTVPRIAIVTPEDFETPLGQDELATPTPVPIAAQDVYPQPAPPRGRKALWFFLCLSLALSLVSLALNAILIYKLLDTRQKAISGVEQAIAALEGVAAQGFHYEYKFDRTIPFSGDIPFQQDIVFPFEGTIPFNTTVTVPVDMGLIQTEIEVPVDTSVYVNTSVPIHVDETIHVDTEIPVSMTIPIDIQPGDPELQKVIDSVREYLTGLVDSF
jgi:hypothetical protein